MTLSLNEKKEKYAIKITRNALFVAFTLVLAYFGKLSVFSVFPYLKFDFSDIPVFLATILYGASSGAVVLFVSNFLRTLLISSAGWTGFVMRFCSMIMVFFLGLFFKKNSGILKKTIGMLTGIIVTVCVKIPINFFVWEMFFGFSKEFLNKILFTILLPYNFFKLLICVLAAIFIDNRLKKEGGLV